MLTEVADGVWVRQSEWVWSNAVVVRADGRVVLVDPGIDGADLVELADDVDRLGVPVIAGFATHPHWDHLLWHPRFGDVPRYATAAGAGAVASEEVRERGRTMAAESATGAPLELLGLVTAVPTDGGPIPGTIIEHDAHAVGHAAILLADRGVLIAGDMLSDALIPMLDARRPDQLATYESSLGLLERATENVDVLIPGHGAVATGDRIAERFAADRAYLDALRRGDEPDDARLEQEWLAGVHRSNAALARPQ